MDGPQIKKKFQIAIFFQGSQKKVNERNILCGRMLFKILDKLWNTYCSSVSDENADSAIKLLVQMYRCCKYK